MSRRFRIGILILVAGLAIAVAGFFLLSTVIRRSIAPLPAPTPLPALTEKVVVVTHDLPIGSLLQAEDLRVIEMPVELASPGAIRDVETAIGRLTKVQLVTGELVMSHHLADPTNVIHDLALIIDDNQVVMAFPATDLLSSLNILQRGDIIDIFASVTQTIAPGEGEPGAQTTTGEEETEITELFTFDALQRVQLTAMVVEVLSQERSSVGLPVGEGEPQPTPVPANIRTKAYLLALSPQDALVLKHLKDVGAVFDIVLRSPTSNQIFETFPVTSDFIIDRYELEVPR